MTSERVELARFALVTSVVMGLLIGVSSVGERAPEPSAVAKYIAGTGLQTSVHVDEVRPALADLASAGTPATQAKHQPARDIDTVTQIETWLSYYELDDEFRSGALPVQVADRVIVPAHKEDGVTVPAHEEDGVLIPAHKENGVEVPADEVAGIYEGGHVLISATLGFNAWVLAHEVSHWVEFQNASFIALGPSVLPNVERTADCMAMVLLSGSPDADKITDCSAADITTSVLLLHDDPLPLVSDDAAKADEAAKASGVSRYVGAGVDPWNSYPSADALRAARARSGITTDPAQWAKDVLAGSETLSLEAARAGGTVDAGWAKAGVSVIDFPLLRQTWGADVLLVDGTVVVDADRMDADSYWADRAIAAQAMTETVTGWSDLPDHGACWTYVMVFSARGWVFDAGTDDQPPTKTTPDQMSKDLPDCTRELLLSSAKLWADAGLSVQPPVQPTDVAVQLLSTDGMRTGVQMPAETSIRIQRRATERDWTDALAAAGLPYAYGTWVPVTS